MYIAHTQNEWFLSSGLYVVTFSLNAGWIVFMEILLMMCLGKSYFLLKTNKQIVPINEDS